MTLIDVLRRDESSRRLEIEKNVRRAASMMIGSVKERSRPAPRPEATTAVPQAFEARHSSSQVPKPSQKRANDVLQHKQLTRSFAGGPIGIFKVDRDAGASTS